jgi:hypothetical protein
VRRAPILELLAGDPEPRPGLAFLAAASLEADERELNAARRRAMLVLAAGGDPHRHLDRDARAVRSLADELRVVAPGLVAALEVLEEHTAGLTGLAGALRSMRSDPYPWLALALLAEEVGE